VRAVGLVVGALLVEEADRLLVEELRGGGSPEDTPPEALGMILRMRSGG
jgi:hypothetical protein